MKNKLIAGLIFLVFGTAFLVGAYRCAQLAHNAPTANGYSMSIQEFAYGFPAAVFTITGLIGVIGGVGIVAFALLNSAASEAEPGEVRE